MGEVRSPTWAGSHRTGLAGGMWSEVVEKQVTPNNRESRWGAGHFQGASFLRSAARLRWEGLFRDPVRQLRVLEKTVTVMALCPTTTSTFINF